MDGLFLLRERFQDLYAKNSRIFDKGLQLILAFATFYAINTNIGYMKMASSPVVSAALAIVCTFLPVMFTVIAASALILAHMYAVSLAALAVTALVFLVMYIFYFRLSPKTALIVLLTPLAFVLKIQYVIPVACALLLAPTAIVAIACGTVTYYMLVYVEKAAAGMKGADAEGLMGQISAYVKGVFQNKEMWVVVAAFVISYLVVYTMRRQSVNHAWKIAVVLGAVVNIVVAAGGDMALGEETDFVFLIVGNVAAIAAGLVLELFFFSVDYARSEKFQYEDDEYYYYVKAVPKLSVATPEKTVKRINERHETEIIDAAQIRRKSRRQEERKSGPRHDMDEVDKMLLTQSLKQDLDLK